MMLKRNVMCCFTAMTMVSLYSATTFASDTQWAPVAEALGKSGTEMAGGVYRVGMPRTDLQVTLDGVSLKPTFALGSWVASPVRNSPSGSPGQAIQNPSLAASTKSASGT